MLSSRDKLQIIYVCPYDFLPQSEAEDHEDFSFRNYGLAGYLFTGRAH